MANGTFMLLLQSSQFYSDILTVTYLVCHVLFRVMIEKTGDVVYPITAGIMGEQLYTASVSVVGSDGVVDALNLNFSELVDFDRVNHIVLGA